MLRCVGRLPASAERRQPCWRHLNTHVCAASLPLSLPCSPHPTPLNLCGPCLQAPQLSRPPPPGCKPASRRSCRPPPPAPSAPRLRPRAALACRPPLSPPAPRCRPPHSLSCPPPLPPLLLSRWPLPWSQPAVTRAALRPPSVRAATPAGRARLQHAIHVCCARCPACPHACAPHLHHQDRFATGSLPRTPQPLTHTAVCSAMGNLSMQAQPPWAAATAWQRLHWPSPPRSAPWPARAARAAAAAAGCTAVPAPNECPPSPCPT